MEHPFNAFTGLQTDLNWRVQGRVIPGSCTGADAVLYVQTRYKDWPHSHYHYGHCPVPAELAVEVAMAILLPSAPKLVTDSLDKQEVSNGLTYVQMVKLLKPEHSLGFISVNGLTIILQVDGIEELFGIDPQCEECSSLEIDLGLPEHPSEQVLDMMIDSDHGKETWH